jgi:hypothetical protein
MYSPINIKIISEQRKLIKIQLIKQPITNTTNILNIKTIQNHNNH